MNNCNSVCNGNIQPRYNNREMNAYRNFNENTDTSCGCTRGCFPVNTSVAMAYVPFQQSDDVYSCDRALSRGTVFPCLDKPFLKGCCK